MRPATCIDRPPITRAYRLLDARVNRAAINAMTREARLRDWPPCDPAISAFYCKGVLRDRRARRGQRSVATFEPFVDFVVIGLRRAA
jgi:hypothetical protein